MEFDQPPGINSAFQTEVEEYLEEKGLVCSGNVWITRSMQQAGVEPLRFSSIRITIHNVHIKMLDEVIIPGLVHIAKPHGAVVVRELAPTTFRGDIQAEANIFIHLGVRLTML